MSLLVNKYSPWKYFLPIFTTKESKPIQIRSNKNDTAIFTTYSILGCNNTAS